MIDTSSHNFIYMNKILGKALGKSSNFTLNKISYYISINKKHPLTLNLKTYKIIIDNSHYRQNLPIFA